MPNTRSINDWRREVERLEIENGALRKSIERLKAELAAIKAPILAHYKLLDDADDT